MSREARTRAARRIAAGVLCLTQACSAGRPPRGEVLSPLDFVETGRRLARARLEEPDLRALAGGVERAAPACVRIRSLVAGPGGSRRAFSGSGILLRGGRLVLTAGHVVPAEGRTGTTVTLVEGTTLPAGVLIRRFDPDRDPVRDWAVLEVPAGGGAGAGVGAGVGVAVEGERVAVLGYPGGIGVGGRGLVRWDAAPRGAPLAPIATLARVTGTHPLELEPIAGSAPVAGSSGGPVLNERGEVVGVVASRRPARGVWAASDVASILRDVPGGGEGPPR